jgi:hypothetical protein
MCKAVELPCVVVRIVDRVAVAFAGADAKLLVPDADTVWVTAVVETILVLAVIAVIAWVAHAPRDGKLDGAPTAEAAVVWAVLDRAVVADERRQALARAPSVADSIAFSVRVMQGLERQCAAWNLTGVRHVHVSVAVIVSCLTAVLTDLLVEELIEVAVIARARRVAAIDPVVTAVAHAKPITAFAVEAAVV